MIKNLFIEAKNPLQAAPYTPGGEPVNYVHPPTIDVDMFTDLVYQHTHTNLMYTGKKIYLSISLP